jgi:prepilin-type N-terminal cleavage/methylation domain-containing protein
MRHRNVKRGFSLVELMVVVAIVAVLALVGVTLFRRWVYHSRSVEAMAMVQSIRTAQERWRAETGAYLDTSTTISTWYPMASPGKTLYEWHQVGHADYARWQLLNPTISGPVQFGYATKAGAPFSAMAMPSSNSKPTWPATTDITQPWFVIQAMGDTDENGVNAYYVASSLNGEVFKEAEGE